MPIDVIIFAIIAAFLIWKLRKVINSGDENFLRKNTGGAGIQVIPEDQIKVATVGKFSEKKAKQLELTAVAELEKALLKKELHEVYDSIFAANPNMRVSLIKQDISQIYEDLMKSIEDATFIITNFAVQPQLIEQIRQKAIGVSYKIFLQKVSNIEIDEMVTSGKIISITATVKSEQIVYKEDKDGNLLEGSKITPIAVTETLSISRPISSSGVWFVENIK